MSVRFIHTADWHLGQLFHQHTRYKEHESFLQQLLDYIRQYQPNALLIAGDIFDVINPPAHAQKQLYQFLADAQQCAKHMQILMIAGNHDSGYRIEQVNPLLDKYQAKAVGVLNWIQTEQGEQLDFEHLIIPIYNEHHETVAWCIALPFLRSAEITGHGLAEYDDVVTAHEKIYQLLWEEVQRRCEAHQAIIMMTHAHLKGAIESKDSERPIIIGHEEAISVHHFAQKADYVALGHLHKAQKVQYDYIRYSGSPIPMSFSEVNYHHQVMLVDIDKQQEQQLSLTPLKISRLVQLIPIRCHLKDLFTQLDKLTAYDIDDIDLRHFLDIEYYSQDIAPPDLRLKVEQAIPEKSYRLVRLVRKIQPDLSRSATSEFPQNITLAPPTPQALFKQLWLNKYQDLSNFDEQLQQDFAWLEQQAHE